MSIIVTENTPAAGNGNSISATVEGVFITQNTYNIFLLEKSARYVKSSLYLKTPREYTRKLQAKDFLFSFAKTAQSAGLPMKSYEETLSKQLARAIQLKYDLNLTNYVGESLKLIAEHLAKYDYRVKGGVAAERRK